MQLPSCHRGRISAHVLQSPLGQPRSIICRLGRRHLNLHRARTQEAEHTYDAQVNEEQTYLGETFWQVQPPHSPAGSFRRDQPAEAAPQIRLRSLNHASVEAVDVAALADFYVNVLSFKVLDRPDLPFDGKWLQGGDLTLHIIEEDPSVPKHVHHWQDKYKEAPQSWYIRRANHLAFEVDDAEAMEKRLKYYGIEHTRAVVPNTEAVQLFFYDPHGNGLEVGSNYGQIGEMLNRKKSSRHTAVSP